MHFTSKERKEERKKERKKERQGTSLKEEWERESNALYQEAFIVIFRLINARSVSMEKNF